MRVSLIALALTTSLSFACAGGSDDDEGGTGADAATSSDAGDDDEADASTSEPDSGSTGGDATALGQECTPTPDNCPEEHVCLPLDGATHPWCSTVCPEQAFESNAGCEGYEGPGAARCILEVRVQGGEPFMACAIVCGDDTGNICNDGETCDGSCPAGLDCVENGNYSYCQ